MLTDNNIANRKLGIGASETAIIMGISNFMTPYQLWRVKTGLDDSPDLSDQPQVHWGSIHEEAIADEYARLTNQKVRRVTNTLFHKDYTYMLCHLDRKIEGKPKVLECKYAMYHSDDWGKSGTDIVPMKYMIQVQHQLAVTGYDEADLAVLISGFDFRVYHFKRDPLLISKIIEAITAFWQLVESNTPPELSNADDAKLAYPLNTGHYINADLSIMETIETYKAIKLEYKKFESEKKALEDKIVCFIKDADGIATDSGLLATWKADVRGTRRLKVLGA